jgi:hypothetical protein
MGEPPSGAAKAPIGSDWSDRAPKLLVPAGFAIVLIAYALPFMDSSGSTISGFEVLLLVPWAWSGDPVQAFKFFGVETLPALLALVGLLFQLDRGRRGLLVGLACSALGTLASFVSFEFIVWAPQDIHLDFGFYIAAGAILMSAVSSAARLLGQGGRGSS